MDKRFIYLILLLLLPLGASAQRLIPNQTGIALSVATPYDKSSFIERGEWGAKVEFSKYLRRTNYYYLGLNYLQQQYPYTTQIKVPVRDYLLSLGYMHPLFSDPWKNFIGYCGLSAVGGYEELNGGSRELTNGALLKSRSRYVYGGSIRGNISMILGDNIVLFAETEGTFLFNTDLGRFRPTASVGIRYNI